MMKIALIVNHQNLTKPEKRLISEIHYNLNLNIILVHLDDSSSLTQFCEQKSSLLEKMLRLYFVFIERIERKIFLKRYLGRHNNYIEDFCDKFNSKFDVLHIDDLKKLESLRDCDFAISAEILPRKNTQEISQLLPLWMPSLITLSSGSTFLFGLREIIQNKGISEIGILEFFEGNVFSFANSFVQTQPIFTKQKFFINEKFITIVIRELKLRALKTTSPKVHVKDDYIRITPVNLLNAVKYLLLLVIYVWSRIVLLVKRRLRMDSSRWRIYFGQGEFEPSELSKSKEITSPSDEFWADPFLHSRKENGKEVTYLFFENFEYATGRGKISVGRLVDGVVVDVRDALVRPYHLSFPFVFEHQGVEYMIPEAGASGRIELWQADNFPDRWRLAKTVLGGHSCADSVIFKHEGNWWLFTNIASDDFLDHCSELHIFMIDSPLMNEIVPHAKNPVMVDARYARNAGRIRLRDGRLVRIAQNNQTHYGFGFSFLEINKLSLHEYEESLIFSVNPDQLHGALATHHFDDLDDFYVYDCRR